jgi:glycosyltransferase involved in cell wall biosynthesis
MANRKAGKVVGFVVLPPPTTGMTIVNGRMSDHLVKVFGAEIISISKQSSRLWFIEKYLKYLLSFFKIILRRIKGARIIYMVPESSKALFVTVFLVKSFQAIGYTVVLHHHVFSYMRHFRSEVYLVQNFGGSGKLYNIFLGPKMRQSYIEAYGNHSESCILSNKMHFPKMVNTHELLDTINIGFLSRLSESKGFYELWGLVDALVCKGVNFCLHIAGPPDDGSVEIDLNKLIKDNPGRIVYHGKVSGETKQSFYANLDVFCFPTRYINEAEPLVVYEALSSGVPVIANNKGDIENQILGYGKVVEECDFCVQALELIANFSMVRQLKRDLVNSWSVPSNSMLEFDEYINSRL